ncbi:Arb2 domain-containing protein [Syncephalis fuscata]|nr:Arb2 domain-containing protein [Syncephalis fuscata]
MFRRKVKPVEQLPTFPNTLVELGYQFADEDKPLRTLKGKRFNFHVKHNDKVYNECHMIAVAEVVGKEVEQHLVGHYQFQKINLPLNTPDHEPHSYIYYSNDYMTNADKLLVLVSDRNNRVGQWDRRHLFDVSIQDGSMFGYIQQAFNEGYAVLVTNPNTNYWRKGQGLVYMPNGKRFKEIPDNANGFEHIKTVFKDILPLSPAKTVNIVTMGYGGVCIVEAIGELLDVFEKRVTRINTIMSTHAIDSLPTARSKVWLREHTVSWVASSKKRATGINDVRFGSCCLSVGPDNKKIYDEEQRQMVFQSLAGELTPLEPEEDDDDEEGEDVIVENIAFNDSSDEDISDDDYSMATRL